MNRLHLLLIMSCLLLLSCVKNNADGEGPTIEWVNPFPCDTIWYGEAFTFSLVLDGDFELANLSMDIHHNFGTHTHGNHESCIYEAPKAAVHPFAAEWVFELPSQSTYTFEETMTFNMTNNNGELYDDGDYHFHIYVTNKEGYLSFTTMDVYLAYK